VLRELTFDGNKENPRQQGSGSDVTRSSGEDLVLRRLAVLGQVEMLQVSAVFTLRKGTNTETINRIAKCAENGRTTRPGSVKIS
jgi:hypothetical protein